MQNILLAIHALIAVALVGVVLMQRSEGGALGIGGGGGGMMSARGKSNFLTRLTAILAAAFMAMALIMAVIAGRTDRGGSIFDDESLIPLQEQTTTSPNIGAEDGIPLNQDADGGDNGLTVPTGQ